MKVKSLVIATTLGLGLTATTAAFAQTTSTQTPSFNYIEGRYVELDEADTTFDGWEAEVSGRLGRYMFISGSYSETSGNVTSIGNTDLDIALGRIGFIFGDNQPIAAYAGPQVSYIKSTFGLGSDGEWELDSDSSTDWGAFAGVRAQVLPMLELNGEVSYIDFERESLTSYSAGAKIFITPALAATGRMQFGDLDGFSVGVAFHF